MNTTYSAVVSGISIWDSSRAQVNFTNPTIRRPSLMQIINNDVFADGKKITLDELKEWVDNHPNSKVTFNCDLMHYGMSIKTEFNL